MQYFFIEVSTDKGKEYIQTTGCDIEAAATKVMSVENCPRSAIELAEVYKYEFDQFPPSYAFRPNGIYKMLLANVNCKYGAPMGRPYKGTRPPKGQKVYDRRVYLNSGGYDIGGAYWGIGGELRVKFCKGLTYWEFYWK